MEYGVWEEVDREAWMNVLSGMGTYTKRGKKEIEMGCKGF
jgi:hypothetical protein